MTKPLRVLIGCATSCVALDAFLARGHDAWQCDLLPADKPTNRHIQGDVRDHLADGWDLLIVCNPPCTRLCNSGVRWLHERNLWADLDEAVALFTACWNAPVERVALENPVMHRHARERMPAALPKPQIVQPWWFGDPAFKASRGRSRPVAAPMTSIRQASPRRSGRFWPMMATGSGRPGRSGSLLAATVRWCGKSAQRACRAAPAT